jgi:hypothetical protein
MTSSEMEPQNIAVTPSSRDYLEKLIANALLEGEPGQQDITSSAQPVLRALHEVLGGGTVSINVETPGNATVVEELNTLLSSAKDEWNRLPGHDGINYF